jgi:hypothetical protein
MRFIFRGYTIFEYFPSKEFGDKVVQYKIHDSIPAFSFCRFIDEDYKLIAQFFDIVYKHTQGEDIELRDIKIS